MPSVQILMPMGGLGTRFTEAGFTTPKPLIKVDTKPMFRRALDSFAPLHNPSYIFVVRSDQDELYDLSSQIKAELPDAKIAMLGKDTRGAVETCMLAEDLIDDEATLIVADCDIYFESPEYFSKIRQAQETGNPEGLLLTFDSNDPRYSYVQTDDAGKVVKTAEKIVISNHAILGGYFFSTGRLFKELSARFLSEELPEGLKEYYLSHLFNLLLAQNGSVEIAAVDNKSIFGTPDELQQYFNEHPQELA